jgi:hypothetical protein
MTTRAAEIVFCKSQAEVEQEKMDGDYGEPCEECGGWQYNHRVGCAAVE